VRLRLAVALGGVAVAALVVGIAVLARGDRSEEDSPVLRGEVISTAASLSPRAHLFGERIRARLDILYDAARIRPASVRANPRFAPYTVVSRSEQRESLGGIGRVRYDLTLECLTRRCLEPESGFFTFPQTGVQYRPQAAGEQLIASVEWPAVRVASRIGLDELEGLELQADVRDLPAPSYRSDPETLTVTGYALAVFLGIAGLTLLGHALAVPALVAGAVARRRARLSPLRRALTLVQRSTEQGERSSSRRALQRLAVELRRTAEVDLARDATHLAWRRSDPSTPSVEPLSDEVERVIAKDVR
jgi:hypothetical protein